MAIFNGWVSNIPHFEVLYSIKNVYTSVLCAGDSSH
jgi:hypothetical protein